MHYYKRNLGDYAKKCGRLTMLQHGSYTLLIDSCYDREKFPTLEEAIDWTWASTEAEVEAVKFVLGRFFKLVDGRYVQERIQQELLEYHEKAETNKRIALERETKRREKSTNRAPDVNEAPPNHKPITKNQEPVIDAAPKGSAKAKRLPVDWVLPKDWGLWALENMKWDDSIVRLEADKFRDYWIARAGKDACKADWLATWRNWCRNSRSEPKAVVSSFAGSI